MSAMRSGGWRGVLCRAAVVAACAVGVLVCAGPAAAAPGLTEMAQRVGLPTSEQHVLAVAMHGNDAYAATVEQGALRVQRYDSVDGVWLPVGPLELNESDTNVRAVRLLTTRRGELYAVWTETRPNTARQTVVVARVRADGPLHQRVWGRVWTRSRHGGSPPELTQVGDEVWVGWDAEDGPELVRIVDGVVRRVPTAGLLPENAALRGLVGYNGAAYAALAQTDTVAAHRGPDGHDVPSRSAIRVRLERLVPVADTSDVRISEVGTWEMDTDDARQSEVFLSAGSPDAPVEPVLGIDATTYQDHPGDFPRIALLRVRADGQGVDRVPITPLILTRGIRRLRGLAATRAGITFAGDHAGQAVRVYTVREIGPELTITDGDPLPGARLYQVPMTPAPAADGALILGYERGNYNVANGHDVIGQMMRYTP